MDIKSVILRHLEEKGFVRATEVAREVGVSRVYINRLMQKLRDEGRIVLVGKANQARYLPATQAAVQNHRRRTTFYARQLRNQGLSEDLILDDLKKRTAIYEPLPPNVARICDYAFLEMLNNAIEHSQSPRIDVWMEREGDRFFFTVRDYGIGVFQNIMQKMALTSIQDAIGELLKGQQTTAPEQHSGEGIFFTSRCADTLTIKSFEKKLRFDNLLGDVFVSDAKRLGGTGVDFAIQIASPRQLEQIFAAYSTQGFEFDRTEVRVKLYSMGTGLLSRSRARRILSGLEAFSSITLDFRGVETIGQAFADEIFRVWQQRFPGKQLLSVNQNPNIDFMIQRARAESTRPSTPPDPINL